MSRQVCILYVCACAQQTSVAEDLSKQHKTAGVRSIGEERIDDLGLATGEIDSYSVALAISQKACTACLYPLSPEQPATQEH